MTRDDETALLHAWHEWREGKTVSDDLYLEFFECEVRRQPRFARIHVFEVLDSLVNDPEADQRKSA